MTLSTKTKLSAFTRLSGILLCGFVFALTFGFPSYSSAKKVKQKLKIEKTSKQSTKSSKNSEDIYAPDWIITDPALDSISFSGYDKPLTASKEAVLITNHSSLLIKSLRIKIVYKDMSGRMLHSRIAYINYAIPPYETRKAEIPTWDTQKSYYYYRSRKPHHSAAPYQVEISVTGVRLIDEMPGM